MITVPSGLRGAWRRLYEPTFPGRGELPIWQLIVLHVTRVVVEVFRQSNRDRLTRQAASLSFQTLLSGIPVAVIALSVLTRLISDHEVDELAEWLSQHMLPSQARAIAPEVQRIASGVDVGALGIVGGVGLFVVGIILLMNVSQVVNDIWKVDKRPLAARVFAAFFILLTFPIMVAVSVFFVERFVRLPMWAGFFAPAALSTAGMFLAFRVIPATKVNNGGALVAAFVVGVSIEASKMGFGLYVAQIEMNYRGLYGAIAFIPLGLLWLYFIWLLFLFGVELSYTIQNLRVLWARHVGGTHSTFVAVVSGNLPLRVLYEIYRRGEADVVELASQLRAAPKAVEAVIEHLERQKMVARDERMMASPARPARDLTVAEVLGTFSNGASTPAVEQPKLDELFGQLDGLRGELVDEMTFADIL